eukprot:gene93-biopygen60
MEAFDAEEARAAQELERRKVLLAEERQRAELERELLVEQEEIIRDELDDRSVIREERDQRRLIRLTASQEALQKTAEALASRSTAVVAAEGSARIAVPALDESDYTRQLQEQQLRRDEELRAALARLREAEQRAEEEARIRAVPRLSRPLLKRKLLVAFTKLKPLPKACTPCPRSC